MAHGEITRYPFEEQTRVLLLPDLDAIADMTAPTQAELNDSDNLDATCLLTVDGLNWGVNAAKVEGRTLCTRVAGQSIGSITYDLSLKGYRDKGTNGDHLWYFVRWQRLGYIVVRYGFAHDAAWAAGQPVIVAKVQFSDPAPDPSGADTNVTFMVATAVEALELKAFVDGSS